MFLDVYKAARPRRVPRCCSASRQSLPHPRYPTLITPGYSLRRKQPHSRDDPQYEVGCCYCRHRRCISRCCFAGGQATAIKHRHCCPPVRLDRTNISACQSFANKPSLSTWRTHFTSEHSTSSLRKTSRKPAMMRLTIKMRAASLRTSRNTLLY